MVQGRDYAQEGPRHARHGETRAGKYARRAGKYATSASMKREYARRCAASGSMRGTSTRGLCGEREYARRAVGEPACTSARAEAGYHVSFCGGLVSLSKGWSFSSGTLA
jgi:hypothetical protein